MTFKEDTKLYNGICRLKRYCKCCNHPMVFYQNSKRNKIICPYCGNYIYKNDLIEFKEKLKKYQNNY